MKRSTKIWIGVVVVLVIAISAGVIRKRRDKGVTIVTTAKVERGDIISKVTANGTIEAKRKVELSANVMGQIVNLAVGEGDQVEKGDFLLQIDKTQLVASTHGAEASVQALLHDRDAARATAQEAELAYERAKRSFDDRLIPQADLDRARAQVESARANVQALDGRIAQARASLEGARDNLSKTTIRAPMSGIITRLPVEEGEVAVIGTMNNPGTQLMTISDMSIVDAVMEVDETDIPNVRVGQKATVTIDSYADQKFTGTVTEVGSSPMGLTGAQGTATDAVNFEVRIQIDDPPESIRPGFSCTADIVTGTREGVVVVPIQALVVREGKGPGGPGSTGTATASEPAKETEGVYTMDAKAGTVKFLAVETGISSETSIEVTSGLKSGEEIVTGPFKALRELSDGAKVKLEEKKKGDKGGKS